MLLDALLFPITNVYAATLLPMAAAALLPAPPAPLADTLLAFLYMGALPCLVFYAVAFLFFLLDVLPPRAWVVAHKFQGARALIPLRSYAEALLVSLRSWGVGLALVLLLCRQAPALGAPPASAPWSPLEFACQLPFYLLAVDACFFCTHKLLHTPLLFAPIHKLHHTFAAPFALAAVYAHPFEHCFSNVLSISLGPLLLRAHPISAGLWGCLAALSTLNSHSGFRLPHISEGHDWHHREAAENFGAGLMLLDWALGTSTRYRQHCAKKAAAQ